VQHDGGLSSIAVVQQDEDLEATAGKIELLWLYTDTMVSFLPIRNASSSSLQLVFLPFVLI
jgi:hypothetical protein